MKAKKNKKKIRRKIKDYENWVPLYLFLENFRDLTSYYAEDANSNFEWKRHPDATDITSNWMRGQPLVDVVFFFTHTTRTHSE